MPHPVGQYFGIQARRAGWRKPAPKINHGWLGRYCRLVTSADKGAVMTLPEEMA